MVEVPSSPAGGDSLFLRLGLLLVSPLDCPCSELYSISLWALWGILVGARMVCSYSYWDGVSSLLKAGPSPSSNAGLLVPPLCHLQGHRFPALGCYLLPLVAAGQVRSSCFAGGKEGTFPVFQVGRVDPPSWTYCPAPFLLTSMSSSKK